MLTSVEVTNPRGDTIQFPLLDSSAGYSVKEIQGLDPVKASVTSSSIAQRDGAQFQHSRRDLRNITMKLGLEPDFVSNSVQSLRTDLYEYLLPKTDIQLAFYLDNILYVTSSGQVESCDYNMFSADPEVNISILCFDPDFYGAAEESLDFLTVSNTDVEVISYEGTTESGIIFQLNINRALDGFAIYNTTPDNSIQVFAVTGSFVAGDILLLSTIPGMKSFTLNRAGDVSSGLFGVDSTADWITLTRGDNNFRVFAEGAPIPYSVSYTPKYGAI